MPAQLGPDGSVIMGAKRSTRNPLINRGKYELGRSLNHRHQVAPDHVFGSVCKRDAEGAADIMFNWARSRQPRRTIDHGRDFLRLNKMAVNAKATGSAQVTAFRSTTDARIVTRPGELLRLKNQVPVDMDRNAVYGSPTPTTNANIGDLIMGNYEAEWVQEQMRREGRQQRKQEKRAALRAQSAMSHRRTHSPAPGRRLSSALDTDGLPTPHARTHTPDPGRPRPWGRAGGFSLGSLAGPL